MFALLTAAVLLVAACGSAAGGPAASDGVASVDDASADPGASSSPNASKDPEEALLAFTRCMREHGIDMPDPQQAGDGGGMVLELGEGEEPPFEDEDFQKADEACRHHLEGAGLGPAGGGELPPEAEEAMLAFARCMREHGIDMPDPQGGGLIQRPGDAGFDPRSEEFQKAEEACREHLEALPTPDAANGTQP